MTVRERKNRNYALLQTVQWILFAVLAFVCYILMTAGSGVKPLVLIPLALCISAHTGEIAATAVGMTGGLLIDLACGKLLGFNAVWLVVCCVAVSLLHSYLLREKFLNMLLLTAVCTAVQGYLDYVFYYAIWGFADVGLIWQHYTLPSGIMTLVSLIPVYLIVRLITRLCGSRRHFELEKTIVREN